MAIRFSQFRDLTARRDSTGCINGEDHEIKAGDAIGWCPSRKIACCAACWAEWSAENAEADMQERGFAGYGY